MHDIKSIRENPEAFKAALARRKGEVDVEALLALDVEKRAQLTELQALQARRNEVAKAIGEAMRSDKAKAEALKAEAAGIKEKIAAFEAAQNEGGALEDALARIPNLLAEDVPEGADESGNVEIRVVGSKPAIAAPKDHVALGEALGLMDFEAAAKLSGARFVVTRGALARLERALAAFMLDLHTGEFGYTEHQVPYLVKDNALFGTGQLPKFAEDLFRTTGEHWLIPTAEVSLTNLVAGDILDESKLPLRLTAHTPCFRSEAGAAGKDTRGMIRQHQFSKVELVSITRPEDSAAEHARMLGCAEEVLKRLGLHYRVLLLCAGDTGFSARKTYDIEVWLPAQDTYREISSCSNCGDFQARRMKARFKRAGAKETEFVHTLNGSGLAVGRTLVAVLENYQQADGSIRVPDALVPYMGGLTVIR
ncbi:MAG: serine--tRNA ligase [Alphaproteobacteria bacterium]|nr:serine--tRNA ligase [Alphaproteobacteria bacterium]